MQKTDYSLFLLEKERDKLSNELKGWDVEEYVNHNDEWKELKDRVKQLNRSIGILKREQDIIVFLRLISILLTSLIVIKVNFILF
jgi:hypothetical protein